MSDKDKDKDIERYMSMRQIGESYNQTSHVIGRWLTRCGLREAGQPTEKAMQDGFCKKIYAEEIGIWIWVWHARKTLAVLENFIQDCMDGKAGGATDGK